MDLKKTHWNTLDKKEFLNYLSSLKNPQKVEFFSRVINTRLPILAIPTPAIKKIANEIGKGDYLSFLDLNIFDCYEAALINGLLICKIKDFNLFKVRLTEYSRKIDNWACCDQLSFNVNKNNEKDFFNLSVQMFNSKYTFERRIAVRIWFKFISPQYLNKIFDIINRFSQTESEYYVNMAVAWFLCECYIKQPNLTLQFLKTNKLNNFTKQKFVSKCCDSFRINSQEKQFLKRFKTN